MRIACLYWPTSSVGGIATEVKTFQREAWNRGYTFSVLVSAPRPTHKPQFIPPTLIRGGDTFIEVNGYAPHHPKNVDATVKFLRTYFDRVYLAYLCPHPTKNYGDQPQFLELLRKLVNVGMPITARITDGYWESYEEWGEAAMNYTDLVTVSHPAYAKNVPTDRCAVKTSRFPFEPFQFKTMKDTKPLTVWTSQWKAIKGIHKLLPHIPEIPTRVEMYSNGIMYYQLRQTEEWKRVVGQDHFAPEFSGNGRAEFFGYIPLEKVAEVYQRAWYMIDLQGHGKPLYEVYKQGSFNNTTVEALYYGAVPVLHKQVLNSDIPKECILTVEDAMEVPRTITQNLAESYVFDPKRVDRAREWVMDNYAASKIFSSVVLGE